MKFLAPLLQNGSDQTYFPKEQYFCPNSLSKYEEGLNSSECKQVCKTFISECNRESGRDYNPDNCEDICLSSGGGDSRKYDRDSQGPFVFQECKNNIDSMGVNCKQELFNCCNKGCSEKNPGNYVCNEQCHGAIMSFCKERKGEPVKPSPYKPQPPSALAENSLFSTTNLSIGAIVILLAIIAIIMIKRK